MRFDGPFESSAPNAQGERPASAIDVLVLSIGDGPNAAVIAIPVPFVREVARVDRITRYPGAPADVPGVTAVHGQIVCVLDLVPVTGGERAVVLLAVETRALAVAGGTPLRVAAAVPDVSPPLRAPSAIGLWSGRLLPLAATVRLQGASRHDAAEGSALPLLDVAALIDDVVDDFDGER